MKVLVLKRDPVGLIKAKPIVGTWYQPEVDSAKKRLPRDYSMGIATSVNGRVHLPSSMGKTILRILNESGIVQAKKVLFEFKPNTVVKDRVWIYRFPDGSHIYSGATFLFMHTEVKRHGTSTEDDGDPS